MSLINQSDESVVLKLGPATAADLMTPNPISIRDTANVAEAVELLAKRGISAAPVIGAAGRPVGVLSQSDLLLHQRQSAGQAATLSDYYERADLSVRRTEAGTAGATPDPTIVRDLMTPAVFSVTPATSAAKVVEEIVALKVHRLFVVGQEGI